MNVIWKYTLDLMTDQILGIPENSKIMTVQLQDDEICMWVRVNAKNPKEMRTFKIVGTGNGEVNDDWVYLGTVQKKCNLVFHVFEAERLV